MRAHNRGCSECSIDSPILLVCQNSKIQALSDLCVLEAGLCFRKLKANIWQLVDQSNGLRHSPAPLCGYDSGRSCLGMFRPCLNKVARRSLNACVRLRCRQSTATSVRVLLQKADFGRQPCPAKRALKLASRYTLISCFSFTLHDVWFVLVKKDLHSVGTAELTALHRQRRIRPSYYYLL